jgi:hypothetical protein
MAKRRPPLWIPALMVAVAACTTTPAASPRPTPTGLDRAGELRAQGEFLEARALLQAILREEPGRPDAAAMLRRLEAAAGIAGLPDGPATRERLILFEVLGHIASGRDLLERGKQDDARKQVERALSEIDQHTLRARFPRSLLAELEEMRRRVGP